jgi:hypothetical protein
VFMMGGLYRLLGRNYQRWRKHSTEAATT